MRRIFLLLMILLVMIPAAGAWQAAPDRDGDTVPDGNDRCPDTPGSPNNGGCPLDRDQDGVADDVDQCISDPGPADNAGCPRPVEPTPQPTQPPQPEQPQPEQPQPEQPQPEQPQTVPQPTVPPLPPAIVLPLLGATGNCVAATQTEAAVNLRIRPDTQAPAVGRLDPTLVYRVYAALETEEGLWYLLRGGWAASWAMRQGGECLLLPAIQKFAPELDLTTDPQETGLLLPAVQKVREAAARMKCSIVVEGETIEFLLDVDSEGEWWLLFPGADGSTPQHVYRLKFNNEPASFYNFDFSALLGDGSVMPAFDPQFQGGVFVGYYHDADPTDNTNPIGALVDYFNQPPDGDPTAAAVDYFLKLDGVDGESRAYPLPTPGSPTPAGVTPLGLFLGAEGKFYLSQDETKGNEDDVPFDVPLFFEISPSSGVTEALKGKPMHLVNNTAAQPEDTELAIKFKDLLVSSVVYNLPPRSVAGWLLPDGANGFLNFAVKDVDGTQTNGILVFDENGDLVFVPEGEDTAAHGSGGGSGKVHMQDFHFVMNTLAPVDLAAASDYLHPGGVNVGDPTGILIGLLEESEAGNQQGQIEIMSWSWGANNTLTVGAGPGGGPHVKVFSGGGE